ncbi:glycosyltransferase family A protein [Aestuariicoccus sp. MJ-SS9]|uniref:glycosyltransferase family A protein n=1 Tax=Aestuariicoccus sp. MJ-SS9 TaxID=3079855 RepID=UPI002909EE7F|nr:glycosyltransferase family A protein [Aestuariicoccus sp. MJ-SS9]MDU8910808.1 glycosyltransferase family A protein [Aestuariicoccus sp. MJ-SS9]
MTRNAESLSVIVPASNEAALIGACLDALLLSRWERDEPVEVIVVANGCRDATADAARATAAGFDRRGWRLQVIERAEGNKLAALNAGDAAATGAVRLYLDADVRVGRDLLVQIATALDTDAPRYASGRVLIEAQGPVSRAYARIWRRVPFMAIGVPGCGAFAVNAAGRARWGAFPEIISDDTFVRLHFAPEERIAVPSPYHWPIAEGLRALIRVRRRQDAGVDQIRRDYPALMANDDTAPLAHSGKLALALRDPVGFAVYSGVALASRLTRARAKDWSRGR